MTLWHRARVSLYTLACAFAQTCVFSKQSPGPILCGLLSIQLSIDKRRSLSRSYGPILPNSLTAVLSSALGCSPRLPVSVCGTDTVPVLRPEAFLGGASDHFSNQTASSSPPGFRGGIFLPATLGLEPHIDWRLTVHSTSPHRTGRWYGNINPLSIVYAFRPRLRVRLTLGGSAFPRKPSAYGEGDSHPFYRYLCRHNHFHIVQDSSRYPFNLT